MVAIDETKQDEYMLTTIDNPYDPFTQFDSWYAYDEQSGYHTCGLMARFALTSNELSEEENEREIDRATDLILNLFPGLYRRAMKSE